MDKKLRGFSPLLHPNNRKGSREGAHEGEEE